MAGDINKVLLIGRLTRDPEVKQTSTGMSYCRFSLAVNRYYIQNEERKEEVSFLNCVAWGKQAEVIGKYCAKGKQIGVEGRLKQNSWQDKEGQARSSIDIIVEQMQLLSSASTAPRQTENTPGSPEIEATISDDDIPF